MKFLYLLLLGVSISIFAAPKGESLEAPIVIQEEIPNLLGKIISIDEKSKSFVVSLDKGVQVTILVTENTYIQYIGRMIKKIKFKDIAVGIEVSINSVDLFKDLQKSKLDGKKLYLANFLSFAK